MQTFSQRTPETEAHLDASHLSDKPLRSCTDAKAFVVLQRGTCWAVRAVSLDVAACGAKVATRGTAQATGEVETGTAKAAPASGERHCPEPFASDAERVRAVSGGPVRSDKHHPRTDPSCRVARKPCRRAVCAGHNGTEPSDMHLRFKASPSNRVDGLRVS